MNDFFLFFCMYRILSVCSGILIKMVSTIFVSVYMYKYSFIDILVNCCVDWDSRGCSLRENDENSVTCICSHLTHFALISVSQHASTQ